MTDRELSILVDIAAIFRSGRTGDGLEGLDALIAAARQQTDPAWAASLTEATLAKLKEGGK
jgi:hypothetical protein